MNGHRRPGDPGTVRFALGYGTNGFANHELNDALSVIADLGYAAVALTLDHAHLNPYAPGVAARTAAVSSRLGRLGMRCVVETGARYLLDRARKHEPTLLSDDPSRRIDFLGRAVAIAADLGADCVSFWSGVPAPGLPTTVGHDRLLTGIEKLLAESQRRGVRLGLEPEPGMLVANLDDALAVHARLGAPSPLGLTLDVGHCVAIEPEPVPACVRRAAPLLVNVQLDDARPGVHEHLEFGTGELDLAATLAELEHVGYRGVAAVELPRHSHAAPSVAASSMAALRSALPPASRGVPR
jgi:sugar phosphate isomerase/epimerase